MEESICKHNWLATIIAATDMHSIMMNELLDIKWKCTICNETKMVEPIDYEKWNESFFKALINARDVKAN